MKYNISRRKLYTLPFLLIGTWFFGQVGIGTLTPKGVLHVESNTMGVVLPKVDNAADVVTPNDSTAVEATFVYDLAEKCTKFKKAAQWSDCLLDDSGVRNSVSSILSVGTEFKVKKASAGYQHTLMIGQDDNALYVAGDNSDGRTGLGRTSGNTGSFLLNFASPLADASAGQIHSIAATVTGEVWAWGDNNVYRTGLGINTGDTGLPSKVAGFGTSETFGRAIKVQAGGQNSYVLTEDGKVYGVGGATGTSAAGPGTGAAATAFTEVSIAETVADISASQYTAAALTSDGKIYVWGLGTLGRLGTGGTANATTPTLISLPGGVAAKQVSMGWNNGTAVSADGKHVYRWGSGNSIGNSGTNLTTPTEISVPGFDQATDEIIAVATQRFDYGYGNLFVFTNKGVYVTGENSQGQLGIGNTTDVTNGLVAMTTTGVYNGTVFTGGSVGRQHTILTTGENTSNTTVSYVAYGMGAINYRQLGAITVQRRVPSVITK
ncbi:RCC1 domain-containing protein [Chryseobacterium sp. CT-SW4]|uniref:RCC1 domain-containing protein n=1 Tax=Chryseobacterium sp. SW-1 TaxID=3157343 RepID=UPI003B023B58